jgi:hypothetical protein
LFFGAAGQDQILAAVKSLKLPALPATASKQSQLLPAALGDCARAADERGQQPRSLGKSLNTLRLAHIAQQFFGIGKLLFLHGLEKDRASL